MARRAELPERPDTEPSFFFRREWRGATPEDGSTIFIHEPDGTLQVYLVDHPDQIPEHLRSVVEGLEPVSIVPDGLVIFGRRVKPMAEDAATVADYEARGLCWSECFSVVETAGEVGTHPYGAVTEISREEFEAAKARGWSDEASS